MNKLLKRVKSDKDIVGLDDNPDLKAIYQRIIAKFYIKIYEFDKALEELAISYKAYLEYYGPYESIVYEILLLKVDILLS